MSRSHRTGERMLLSLALLSALCLVFNMAAMPLHAEEVFLRPETVSAVEIVMLVGFGLVFIFNVLSVVWLARWRSAGEGTAHQGMLVLGILCLILMAAEKVMIDEVGHEWQPGAGVETEAIILYVLLTIQLTYNVLIARLLQSRKAKAILHT